MAAVLPLVGVPLVEGFPAPGGRSGLDSFLWTAACAPAVRAETSLNEVGDGLKRCKIQRMTRTNFTGRENWWNYDNEERAMCNVPHRARFGDGDNSFKALAILCSVLSSAMAAITAVPGYENDDCSPIGDSRQENGQIQDSQCKA